MQHSFKAEGQDSGLDTDTTETKCKKTHTFRFKYNEKKYIVTCDASMSVLESLQTDKLLKAIYKKNQDGGKKEIVIRREHMPQAAVTPHFPCCLINNNELLNISFIKSSDGTRQTVRTPVVTPHTPEDLVCFYIRTKGEDNIRKPMKNNELQKKVDYVCVYAVKGEQMKVALKRDDRFNIKVFSRGALQEKETDTIMHLSNPVDCSDKKQFVIIFCPTLTGSQESSQESSQTVKEEKSDVPQGEKDNQTPTNAQEKKNETPQEKQKRRKYPAVKPIPDTEEILKILREQFGELLKVLKEREKLKTNAEVKRFFREEYDKSAQSFSEVKRVKRLMALSDFVCQIRADGSPAGSGFLLFDRFVLTNAHVVEKYLKNRNSRLMCKLKVAFDFEDLSSVGTVMEVKENVVAFLKGKDHMGNYLDFALLELNSDKKFPPGLMQCYIDPPARGGVCIIGHPGGEVKQMDPCFIVARENVPQEADELSQQNPAAFNLVAQQWGNEDQELHTSQIYYNSCFFHESSGSPLFDDQCNLIGVHTGGYVYKEKIRSVVEYGLPMLPILVQIYIQCSKRSEILQYIESQNNLKHVVKVAKEFLPADLDTAEFMDTSK